MSVKSVRIRDLTQGSPVKLIVSFALPLMAGNVFQQLYTIVDTAVVGQGVGIKALSALGAADWLNWFVISIIQGFAHGFSILMAQYFGAKDYKQLNQSIGISITLSIIICVSLLVVSHIITVPLLTLMNTPADILPDSVLYLRFILSGIPIIMFYNLLSSILRALGDSKTPLYAMIVAALSNVVLDLLFVMVFHWGIPGAAIATLIAQLLSVVYCAVKMRKIDILHIHRDDLKPKKDMVRALFRLGTPVALQNAIIAIGGMVVQSVINVYGVLFIAGYTATNKLYGLLEIAATSFGYAVTTYVGQNLGAKLIGRIKKGLRASAVVALFTSVIIGAAMILFGKLILGIFLSGTPSEIKTAMDIAYCFLFIMSVCLPILYMLHIYRSALMGLGNTVVPMISGFAEMALRIAVVFVLPAFMGQDGVLYAEVAAWTAATVILVSSYYLQIRRYPDKGSSSQAEDLPCKQ